MWAEHGASHTVTTKLGMHPKLANDPSKKERKEKKWGEAGRGRHI